MLSIHRLTFRLAFVIVPVVVVILHVVGAVRLELFDWIDNLIYDTRLRVTRRPGFSPVAPLPAT